MTERSGWPYLLAVIVACTLLAGSARGEGVAVNLNTATEPALMTLPDMTADCARRIRAYRRDVGGFTSVDVACLSEAARSRVVLFGLSR